MDTKLTPMMERLLRYLGGATRDERHLPGGKGTGRLNGWVGMSPSQAKTYRALESRGLAVTVSRGAVHITAAGLKHLGQESGTQGDPAVLAPAAYSVDALKTLCAAGGTWACEELDRRGVEPDVIEPKPAVTGDMTIPDVNERDRETIGHLTTAESALQAALKSMPNDRRSAFDPASDVPALERALRDVQQSVAFAQAGGR